MFFSFYFSILSLLWQKNIFLQVKNKRQKNRKIAHQTQGAKKKTKKQEKNAHHAQGTNKKTKKQDNIAHQTQGTKKARKRGKHCSPNTRDKQKDKEIGQNCSPNTSDKQKKEKQEKLLTKQKGQTKDKKTGKVAHKNIKRQRNRKTLLTKQK